MTTAAWVVLRGGSWYNFSRFLRASYRGKGVPPVRFNDIGFRIVVKPKEGVQC